MIVANENWALIVANKNWALIVANENWALMLPIRIGLRLRILNPIDKIRFAMDLNHGFFKYW